MTDVLAESYSLTLVQERITEVRPGVHVICGSFAPVCPPLQKFEEMLKVSSVPTQETEPKASPAEQWAALEEVLKSPSRPDYITRMSGLVRDICDAVTSELFHEVLVCP